MTPEELKEFIELESSVVSAGVALLTFVGLPDCGKSKLVQEILQKEFKMTGPGKLMKINEKNTEFSVFEIGAIRRQGVETWEWCQLAKRSRYLSCFVSALKRDTKKQKIKFFANPGSCNDIDTDLFKSKELNKCFYNLYQLLHDFYNESANPETTELKENDTLTLINVWDIGFNRAFLHFYPFLCGHLHHNYPILFLGCPNDFSTHEDGDRQLDKTFNVDKCGGMLAGMEPILGQYSRVKYLLSFSHMARSYDRRRQVSQVAAIVHCPDRCSVAPQFPETSQHPEPSQDLKTKLQSKIETKAKEFNVEDVLKTEPWVFDQKITEQEEGYQALKKKVDSLVESEKQKNIPLSWYFLRSAFYKTGQLFIKTADLRECACKCKITDANFEEFLKKFTGFGSIIHIPELCDYVILNPPDFFHKLNELYYPRFNGDLQYGIASFSTLKRLFGEENFSFFITVLTAINLAVKIDSDRVVKDGRERQMRLLIKEECLYIPSIRTIHVARPDLSSSASSSTGQSLLRIVYKKMHLPTHTSEDVIKFLLQSDPQFHLLTCEWYNVTRFQYYYLEKATALVPEKKHQVVTLTMISHDNENEMLIEENEEANNTITGTDIKELIAEIKKKVIKAYCDAGEMYRRHHYRLLGVEPELELELHSTTNIDPSKYHWHSFTQKKMMCAASCEDYEAIRIMWMYGKEHWKAS